MFHDIEHGRCRPGDYKSVLLIEALGIITGIKHDRGRARGARPAFAFLQDRAAQSAALRHRIDRHEPHLRFGGGIEMQTSDRQGRAILARQS